MKPESVKIDILKKLVADMIPDADKELLRLFYKILARKQHRTGRLQLELHKLIEEMTQEDLRLLYVTALELTKGGDNHG